MNIEKIKQQVGNIWTLINEQRPETAKERKAINSLLNKLSEFEEELDIYKKSPVSDTTKNTNITAIGHNIQQNNQIH